MAKPNYDGVNKNVVAFLNNNKRTVYLAGFLVKTLKLEELGATSRGLIQSLLLNQENLGLLIVRDVENKFKPYFGISDECGKGNCFSNWCSTNNCRSKKNNPKIRYHRG